MALKRITTESANRFCALTIGPAGIGKTSLLRTIAGQQYDPATETWKQVADPAGCVCTLSAESGLLCVRDLVADGLVEGYEIGSFADMREAYSSLVTADFRQHYQWVFIDSLTEISARCVEEAKSKYPSSKDTFPMWGEYNNSMTSLVKAFRDLTDYNVIFTCLETVDKDANGYRYKSPMISGSALKERLTSYFDEVLYMSRMQDENGVVRTVFNTREPIGVAKDRSGKLNMIESANLLTIHNKILD